jgi:hypothetical protein
MKPFSFLILFITTMGVLAACQSPPIQPETLIPTNTPIPASLTTAVPDTPPSTSETVIPTSTPTVPTPIPTASPTPLLVTIAERPHLPPAVQERLNTAVAQLGWDQTGETGDLYLRFDQPAATNAPPLADWTLAAVVPFPTVLDEIPLADLQRAWQAGTLHLTAETTAVLRDVWGEPATLPILHADPETLIAALWNEQSDHDTPVVGLLPFDALTPRLKVLRVGGQAPTAPNFDPDSYPLRMILTATGEDATIEESFTAVWGTPLTNRDDTLMTHITLSGPAGMRRAVAHRMDLYGMNYPGEETGPVLQAADIAHMSNENPFATDCPVQDPFDSENVCNRTEYIALMTWMGIDVNEMTGNHLNDWGTAALDYTFDLYAENGIETYGGGRDLADAQTPLLIEHNGHKIAFVGCNPVGPEYGWATASRPGAAPCGDYAQLMATIRQLSTEGYLVFVTIQEEEDYQYGAHWALRARFQEMAAAGATAVSGSHAHHPQGFALTTPGSFVHYGLGNLLADQMWSLGSRQMFLDTYTLYHGRLLNVDLWTGLNEDYARVRAMTPEERAELLRATFAESDW